MNSLAFEIIRFPFRLRTSWIDALRQFPAFDRPLTAFARLRVDLTFHSP